MVPGIYFFTNVLSFNTIVEDLFRKYFQILPSSRIFFLLELLRLKHHLLTSVSEHCWLAFFCMYSSVVLTLCSYGSFCCTEFVFIPRYFEGVVAVRVYSIFTLSWTENSVDIYLYCCVLTLRYIYIYKFSLFSRLSKCDMVKYELRVASYELLVMTWRLKSQSWN